MNIGISAAGLDPVNSGSGRYALELFGALLEEAPYHRFVLFVLERDRPHFAFAETRARIIGVAEQFRPPPLNLAWHQLVLPRWVRQLELDVLHVATVPNFPWFHPCALVGTVPEVPDSEAAPDGHSGNARCAFLAPLARRQDELVVPTTRAAERVVRAFRTDAARVTVIPNGVDHHRFRPKLDGQPVHVVARAHGIDPPFFLCVARLEHPAKNHVRLIDAFTRFKTRNPSPWQLVLIGADAGGSAAVRDAIRHSPYAPDIHAMGRVPVDQLPDWYRAAGAFIAAGARHGLGLAALEAMASGCPVVAAAGSAAADLGEAAVLVTDATDTGAIRETLTRIAHDSELRRRLGFAGILQAGRHTWRKTAAATLEVYARAARRIREPVLAIPALPGATG